MKQSNLNKITAIRENKKTRDARPFNNFMEIINRSESLLSEIKKKITDETLLQEAMLQYVIVDITALEIYFKDLFSIIFELCDDEDILNRCINLIDKKFSFKELLLINKNQMKPEEILLTLLNFQNIGDIDKAFSAITNMKIFNDLKNREFHTGGPKNLSFKLPDDYYSLLNQYIELRHNLVHDFNTNFSIVDAKLQIYHANMLYVIVAIDLLIHKEFIEKNLKVHLMAK